jgi:hypothetical protein
MSAVATAASSTDVAAKIIVFRQDILPLISFRARRWLHTNRLAVR